jgi:hypothetical protein
MARPDWRRWAWMCLAAQGLTGATALAQEPVKYSQDWWAWRAQDPPGTRQVEKEGKLWPPYARPVGPEQHWKHKYHHAHYWPYPYNCADEAYVRNVIDMQSNAGWVSATTLLDYHFLEDTHELNTAGRGQLFWILTHCPAQYRTVYVAQGMSPQIAQVRLARVQEAAKEFAPEGSVPIVLRQAISYGRSAEEIDQLRRLELTSTPRPRLFVVGTGSRGSAGAGSGSGSGGGGQQSGSGGSGGGGTGTGTR